MSPIFLNSYVCPRTEKYILIFAEFLIDIIYNLLFLFRGFILYYYINCHILFSVLSKKQLERLCRWVIDMFFNHVLARLRGVERRGDVEIGVAEEPEEVEEGRCRIM